MKQDVLVLVCLTVYLILLVRSFMTTVSVTIGLLMESPLAENHCSFRFAAVLYMSLDGCTVTLIFLFGLF